MFFMLVNFFRSIATNSPRPKIEWKSGFSEDTIWGELTIKSDLKPKSVNIKYSETVEDHLVDGLYRRDFRYTVPNNTWIAPGEWESDKDRVIHFDF